jgi:hypothetical protein
MYSPFFKGETEGVPKEYENTLMGTLKMNPYHKDVDILFLILIYFN